MSPIGQQIKRAREEQGLSHERLSDLITSMRLKHEGRPLRVSAPAIWRIERGENDPKFTTLLALAAGLRVVFTINSKGVQIR